MSKFPISLKAIKGPGWAPEDNLREIRQGVGGAPILDACIRTSATATRQYRNLIITDEALLDGTEIVVTGNCTLISGRIDADKLIVYGHLYIASKLGDTYTNVLQVDELIVYGSVFLKDTQWTPSNDLTKAQHIGGSLIMQNVTGWTENNSNAASKTPDYGYTFIVHGTLTADNTSWVMNGGHWWDSDNTRYEGSAGLCLNLWVDGNLNLPNLTSLSAKGGGQVTTCPYGGDGGHILISAGGDLTVGVVTINTEGHSDDPGLHSYAGDGGDVELKYNSLLAGSITIVTTGGDGSVGDGDDGTVDHVVGSLNSNHRPMIPVIVSSDYAVNPDEIEFSIPQDENGSSLDFEITVERCLLPVFSFSTLIEDTNSSPGSFDGAPPYTQGSGTVKYTLPALDEGRYRCSVSAMKDADVTKKSLVSEFRYFDIIN